MVFQQLPFALVLEHSTSDLLWDALTVKSGWPCVFWCETYFCRASCSLSIPYCVANVEKCLGCRICMTKLSGGVSLLSDTTRPNIWSCNPVTMSGKPKRRQPLIPRALFSKKASTCVCHYSLIRNVATRTWKMNNTWINPLNTMYLQMLLYKLPCLLSRRANA